MTDPFTLLGVTRTATVDEIRRARRRLAFDAHPDSGGSDEAMQQLNAAVEAAVAHVTGRRTFAEPGADPRATEKPRRRRTNQSESARSEAPSAGRLRVERDAPSFVIETLPVDAFEALVIVANWLGDVVDDEPPYLLEVLLREPIGVWCRLELVPDAGASTVTLTVAAHALPGDRVRHVEAEAIRDVWVYNLNRLGDLPTLS